VIAGGGAQGLAHLAGFSFAIMSVRKVGSSPPLRQPSAPPSRAVWLFEIGERQLGEILAALRAGVHVLGALGSRVELRRSGFLGYRDEDVGDVVLVVRRRGFRLFLEVLIDLAGRNAYALQDVALAEQAEGELFTHVLAVGGVVDALLLQSFGQLRQGMPLRCATSVQGRVQGLVRDLQAGLGGTLGLDFLQDQALQHLLAQHVLGRQLELLRPQALAHDGNLVVELAVQHHAVVDHGGDAIEELAFGGELAGLRAGLAWNSRAAQPQAMTASGG
jgi:hypothetical protein